MKGNFFIHPDALTGSQYEELKQLIPDACKIKGCNNNYSDPYAYDIRFSTIRDVCNYHYYFPNHRPPFFAGKTCGNNFTGSNSSSQTSFTPPPPSFSPQTQTPFPAIQTVQFTLSKVDKISPDLNFFYLRTNPFV